MKHVCPVCGYSDLTEPPCYNNDPLNSPSHEICPSCGFQFGYSDLNSGFTFSEWRQKWITEGAPWCGKGTKTPKDWNPVQQLENIGVKLSQS